MTMTERPDTAPSKEVPECGNCGLPKDEHVDPEGGCPTFYEPLAAHTEGPTTEPLCQTCGQNWDADVAAEKCTYPECPYLGAAHTEGEAQPVAWRWRSDRQKDWQITNVDPSGWESKFNREVQPLFTSPQGEG